MCMRTNVYDNSITFNRLEIYASPMMKIISSAIDKRGSGTYTSSRAVLSSATWYLVVATGSETTTQELPAGWTSITRPCKKG
jgi:hypothetical protein